MAIRGDFQGLTCVTKGGGSKNWKFGMMSFMDGPLSKLNLLEFDSPDVLFQPYLFANLR